MIDRAAMLVTTQRMRLGFGPTVIAALVSTTPMTEESLAGNLDQRVEVTMPSGLRCLGTVREIHAHRSDGGLTGCATVELCHG